MIGTPINACLDLWRQWAGINPLAFYCIDIDICTNCPTIDFFDDDCKYWSEYPWQSRLSRQELERCLCSAIEKVQAYLETFITPTWVCKERIKFPECYTKTGCVDSRRWKDIKVHTKWKHIIDVGQQNLEVIANPQVAYIDEDGDGWCETGCIEFTVDDDFEPCDISFYHVDELRQIELCDKICPVCEVKYNQETNTVTAKFNAELLIKPKLYKTRKLNADERTINGCDKDNFVTHIAVLKEKVDDCKPQALAYYYKTDNCKKMGCALSCYPLCIQVDDKCNGIIHFEPMEWDQNEECAVETGCSCHSHGPCFPEFVDIWYKAGIPDCFNCTSGRCYGSCCTVLEQVYKLASACLPRQYCDCIALKDKIEYYQYNPQMNFKADGINFNIPFDSKSYNPFGITSIASIEAFQTLREYKWDLYDC